MSQPQKIYELIPIVMEQVGAIPKKGENTFDNYKFRSIDDVYNSLQPVLAKNKVFFIPTVLESQEEKIQSSKGKVQQRVILKVQYKIYTTDGSFIECTVQGEGIDRSDKASNKALTAAFKYMLIQIFCIAVEGMDDADKESPEMDFVKGEDKSQKSISHVIRDGKYKGRNIEDIPKKELKDYVMKISSAIKKTGKETPVWFHELQQTMGEIA